MFELTEVSITRRILAIIGVTCFFGVLTYLSIWKESELAIGALVASGNTILVFYFVEKVKKN